MIKRLIGWLVFVPLCAILIVFALANRHFVAVNFDPLTQDVPLIPALNLPLFAVIFASLLVGVLLGGMATWASQGKHRREKRALKKETGQLKKELDVIKAKPKQTALGASAADDLLELE